MKPSEPLDPLNLYAALRQMLFPAALRIRPSAWAWRLLQVKHSNPPIIEVPESFSRELGTGLFRMERSATKVKVQAGPSEREFGQMRRLVEQMRKLLAKHEIEVLDLTGQPIPPGRQDFEILGEPERIDGVTEPTISFCSRPAVMMKGRLIQTAQGTVSLPAKTSAQEND